MPKATPATPVDDEVVMPLRIVCTIELDDPLLLETLEGSVSPGKMAYAVREVKKLMEAMDLDLQRVAADYTTRIGAVVDGLIDG